MKQQLSEDEFIKLRPGNKLIVLNIATNQRHQTFKLFIGKVVTVENIRDYYPAGIYVKEIKGGGWNAVRFGLLRNFIEEGGNVLGNLKEEK